ncbi:hypothetical protein OWV82_006085 [Melia azedarach]|uniref:Uncharacterized protein n=1 Tax=Melia azedarach TaxID=155640 RepID=A0ACC1YFP7_MELAZ|nr:hypothetical protein OWV82_006085 [Melia azedarach]
MEFHRTNVSLLAFLLIFSILFSSSTIQLGAASRPLYENPLLKKYFPNLINQSLQRGPVPPIGGSPCTHIPGGGGHCPNLQGMNFAGRLVRSPPAAVIVDFPVASSKNKNRQDESS